MHTKKEKYQRIRKNILLFFLILFCLYIFPLPVRAADGASSRSLKVAYTETPGLSETTDDGRLTGLIIDYLNEISKYTNWTYEFIATTADDMILDFIDGKFDLMGGTLYDPSFEDYFAYPRYTMGASNAVLFCRKDDTSIHSYDLSSLNGKTIGVYKNAVKKIEELQNYLDTHSLSCHLKYYTYEDMKDDSLHYYLEAGEVDLLLGNDIEENDFIPVVSFESQPYYLVTTPGNQEILDGLNMALEKIMDSKPDFATDAYQKNFPSQKSLNIRFNDEEKEYIEKTGTIRVAAMSDWNPFYYSDTSGTHNGIIPDVLDRISELTGLEFKLIYAGNYDDTINLVKSGNADLLGCYLDSDYDALQQDLALTSSFLSMNNTVVKNKSVDYPSKDLTAGLIKGRTLPPEIKAANVRYYKNVEDGLKDAENGRIDFMYGLSTSLEQSMQSRHFTNLSPLSLVNNSSEVSFAAARPMPSELLTILNKGISSISSSEIDSIIDRNIVSMSYSSMSLSDLIYASPVSFVIVIAVILVLILMGVLITVRYRVKNTLMQNELEKAESESRAKGEFLSRMSHEIRTPMNAISGLAELTCMLDNVPAKVAANLEKIRSSSQYLLSLINDILDMSRIDSGMMVIASEDFSIHEMLEDLVGMIRVQASRRSLHFDFQYDASHDCLCSDSIRLRQVLTNLLSNAVKFTPAGGRVVLCVSELSSTDRTARFLFSVTDNGVGIAPEDQEQIFGTFEQIGPNRSKSEGTGLGLPISRNIVQLLGGELKVESTIGEGSRFYFTLDLPLSVSHSAGTEQSISSSGKDAREPQPALPASLVGKRILLAEDNDLNAEIAEEILTLKGLVVERVKNGKEAVDHFLSNGSGYYKLILMDIRMPVMDGHEASRMIRASGHPDAGRIPVIAMTANSFREDVDAAREAGMDGFIPKPFDSANLFETINRHII